MIDRQNFTCESKVQKKVQTKQENKEHSVPHNRVAASILEITTRAWLASQVNFSKKNSILRVFLKLPVFVLNEKNKTKRKKMS